MIKNLENMTLRVDILDVEQGRIRAVHWCIVHSQFWRYYDKRGVLNEYFARLHVVHCQFSILQPPMKSNFEHFLPGVKVTCKDHFYFLNMKDLRMIENSKKA